MRTKRQINEYKRKKRHKKTCLLEVLVREIDLLAGALAAVDLDLHDVRLLQAQVLNLPDLGVHDGADDLQKGAATQLLKKCILYFEIYAGLCRPHSRSKDQAE